MSGAYLPLLLLFGISVATAVGMVVATQILNPRFVRFNVTMDF